VPVSSSSAKAGIKSEGPWMASCSYWAPAWPADSQLVSNPQEVHMDQSSGELHWHLDASASGRESGCNDETLERWGIPTERPQVDVTAIIATVPDPVHTHLAITFDRSIDAILQAAADNNYVSSYYWLPWRNRAGALRSAEPVGDFEPGHDSERERQPGLIILKYSPPKTATSDKAAAEGFASESFYYRVIYLFLVAETPTQGIDGFQLRNAFSYEDYLQGILGASRFSKGRNHSTAIIGPLYTGSAASLRRGIESEIGKQRQISSSTPRFQLRGETSTQLAEDILMGHTSAIDYLSFYENGAYDREILLRNIKSSGYDCTRVAFLIEENTAVANANNNLATAAKDDCYRSALKIRYPREISLLRNAQVADDQPSAGGVVSPTPYLHFSLKDYSAQDSVPQFSRENTPLSQEAQLMTIARQLHRFRSEFIVLVASNPLDQIFLAQFLHRACPDARLVFFGGDLLMEREIDNVPFIGAITITPYSLIGLGQQNTALPSPDLPIHIYPESTSVAFYNAASYTFWDASTDAHLPVLKYYRNLFETRADLQHPSLWATAIGSDGYYPLAILSRCASNTPEMLPTLKDGRLVEQDCSESEEIQHRKITNLTVFPSRTWVMLCLLVSLLCLLHFVFLLVADYWSPFTRDLAIADNDQPRRRSMYINIGVAMLFSMAFVVGYPVLALSSVVSVNGYAISGGCVTVGLGILALASTFQKTRPYILPKNIQIDMQRPTALQIAYRRCRSYLLPALNLQSLTTLIGLPLVWAFLCTVERVGDSYDLVGPSFSYRCVNPGSGVSPAVPVLLLLAGWYLWAFFQTWRLRFSDYGRPRLPGADSSGDDLFVSDKDLNKCRSHRDPCLFKNITCLFIVREIIHRFRRTPGNDVHNGLESRADFIIDIFLALVYFVALICFSLFTPFRSLDHFLWNTHRFFRSSPYEFLIGILFFPLVVVALTGWLRIIFIWGALKRGLLERLEEQPIRFSFNRLKRIGWMAMLRQGGLQEQWRDMARSIESMRQILHLSDLKEAELQEVEIKNENLLRQLRSHIDRVDPSGKPGYERTRALETRLAGFCDTLLQRVLLPYWQNQRTGLVNSEDVEELPITARRSRTLTEDRRIPLELQAVPVYPDPNIVVYAEEFLAIRYLSLIRAALANMRYLMIFVSTSFVLAIVAWNSYPFLPRQYINWLFTGLLLFLGSGIVWVFAEMYRDPILSRITETKANELGLDFYIRIFSFGVVPVITWLAYQFPDVGSVIFRFLQPSVEVLK
jgi:hypothetical protein